MIIFKEAKREKRGRNFNYCDHCDYVADRPVRLNKHMKRAHNIDEPEIFIEVYNNCIKFLNIMVQNS